MGHEPAHIYRCRGLKSSLYHNDRCTERSGSCSTNICTPRSHSLATLLLHQIAEIICLEIAVSSILNWHFQSLKQTKTEKKKHHHHHQQKQQSFFHQTETWSKPFVTFSFLWNNFLIKSLEVLTPSSTILKWKQGVFAQLYLWNSMSCPPTPPQHTNHSRSHGQGHNVANVNVMWKWMTTRKCIPNSNTVPGTDLKLKASVKFAGTDGQTYSYIWTIIRSGE